MTKLEKLGIKIGHYTNKDGITGATVIIPDNGADIGVTPNVCNDIILG